MQPDFDRISEKLNTYFVTLTELIEPQNREVWHQVIAPESIRRNLEAVRRPANAKDTAPRIALKRQFEDDFFRAIFTFSQISHIYHYTTLNFAFSILNQQTLRMSSIAGINDRSEINSASTLLTDEIKLPIHHKVFESASERFILACSKKDDDLTQWRLYGDDGRGVCLKFQITDTLDNHLDFTLGRILYGRSLLRALKNIRKEIHTEMGFKLLLRRLFLWRHFMKHVDYKDEEEIRLLYFNDVDKKHYRGRKWKINRFYIINSFVEISIAGNELPLRLQKVTLGPKCYEKELNRKQCELFLKDNGLGNIEVALSKLSHYR
ncbi:MAG: DUF2971 domain-containing protein [Bacteroidota bacterium]|nr:DUF2971 domain-containing protein [Bacteroidota bacterium]